MSESYDISPRHYDDIPDAIMQGPKSILEFGPATGINQLSCRHRNFFIENNNAGRYLGIDIKDYDENYLQIIQGDIRTYETSVNYELVIALHVIEHIEIDLWPDVISRLQNSVASGGHLIIGTPFKEPSDEASDDEHVVFDITKELIRQYLPDAEIREVRNYPFHEDGVRFWRALLRYVKRWITRHPYVTKRSRLLVIWRSER